MALRMAYCIDCRREGITVQLSEEEIQRCKKLNTAGLYCSFHIQKFYKRGRG